MNHRFEYAVPLNTKIFKSNYDYLNGIGKMTRDECIDRSLLVSGVKLVDHEDFEQYIKDHQLQEIFLR